LHPKWRQGYDLAHAPVMFELDLEAVLARPVAAFQPVSRFQAVERDIAVVVADGIGHSALMRAVRTAPVGGLLRDAVLFDVYRPKVQAGTTGGMSEGEKSLAVRLTLNSDDATLTEEQIDSAVQAVISELGARLGARLR